MDIDKINKLISKLSHCTSQFETYRNGKKISIPFAEFQLKIVPVLRFFTQNNVHRNDTIGIIGSNSLEWVIIDLACIAAGVITVPFDPSQTYSAADLITEFELPFILSNIELYQHQSAVFSFQEVCNWPQQTGDKIMQPVQYQPEDILTYKFTSGSTQRPKVIGAMKQSVDAAITYVQQLFQHNSSDKIMIFLPLHTYQQRYWIYSAILFDFNLLLVPAAYLFHSIVIDKPTVIMGVPFFLETVMKNFLAEVDTDNPLNHAELKNKFQQQMGGNIRYLWTGSAPLSRDTLLFYEQMEMHVFQGYGMNEVCIVAKNNFSNNRAGSVGKLLPGKHIQFDEHGQLLIKSDYPVNTRYYKAAPEDTNATFLKDGYVATGDLGHLDDDGYLFITGRTKELIVLANAIKIHPAPVEKKIETSKLVKHCVVYGDGHPYLVALIVAANKNIVHAQLKQEIAQINERLQPQEKICNFILAGDEFGEDQKRFSAQNKILRSSVIADYKESLEKLYLN